MLSELKGLCQELYRYGGGRLAVKELILQSVSKILAMRAGRVSDHDRRR